MKNERFFGEIKASNTLPYQHHVTINSKPALTGFGVTLSKNYYMWLSTTPTTSNFLEFSEPNFTK
jgi:hypothetical protein